jgi:3-deoxy-D-manno-octulosonic-acid transferase
MVVRGLLWPLAHVARLVSDRVKEQVDARPNVRELTVALAAERRRFQDCVVFFCSSAGEYEQAKPVIDRLVVGGNTFCHVFFFSVSGSKFLTARKDPVSWSLSPPDDAFLWGSLFSALRPSRTIVVRHELWPAFLWSAAQWSNVVIINAVVPSLWGRQGKWREKINLAIKSWLFTFADLVCVVASSDQGFFAKWLRIPADKILITGDTKFDRVVERSRQKRLTVTDLRERFRTKWRPDGCDFLLIGGSVHLPDIELIAGALIHADLARVKILLVPHDISSGNVARIFDRVGQLKLRCELLSELENAEFEITGEHPRVIIADEMGRLSELYGVADFAWVGGAVHGKVHNVLEPAAWGLPVSCGVNFQNSQEAEALHSAGLLFAAQDAQSLEAHWVGLLGHIASRGEKTRLFAESMAGATTRVVDAITIKRPGEP